MTSHPFLATEFHIPWSRLTPDHVVADIEQALATAQKNIDEVCITNRGKLRFETVFQAYEAATEQFNEAWGRASHLKDVCDSQELRDAYNAVLPKVTEFQSSLPLNESLWDLFRTFMGTPEAEKMTPVQRRFADEVMSDFRASGADLPPDKKARLKEVDLALAQITQKYGENVLDSTNQWSMLVEDESRLAGLPPSARDAALSEAKAKGLATDEKPAWRFTLKAPSLLPVLEHAVDDSLRQEIWEASSQVGLQAPWDNSENIRQILRLRQEKAELLGKANFADLVLERRMARNGHSALKFVEDLHDKIRPMFQRQCRELQEYKAEATHQHAEPLNPWEVPFWAEHRRKALFDFDDEELRPYFPMDGVLAGLFRLCEQLFSIQIVEKPTIFGSADASAAEAVEVWHPEVKFYEIHDPEQGHLGSFYADWHPRDSKRGGAWMNYLRTGTPPTKETARTPHLGLMVGNMTPPVNGKPALLTHGEVETVFHEFGHLLHHLLGNVDVKSLNGVNVAWDFVELPSQIMENFCWDRESLNFFALHHETNEPIPQKLFKKLLAARNYNSAVITMRQLAFGKMDLGLHINFANTDVEDLDAAVDELTKTYQVPLKVNGPTMARRFNHLFSNPVGYAAGYYSYKWAEVLDADCFTRFQKEGILNPETGRDFREQVLSKGNSQPPEVLFRAFMGRDPDLSALLIRSGLA